MNEEFCIWCGRRVAGIPDYIIYQNTRNMDDTLCWNPEECMTQTDIKHLVAELRSIAIKQQQVISNQDDMISDLVFYADHAPMCKAKLKESGSYEKLVKYKCTCGLNDTLTKYNNNFHRRR